LSEFAPPVALVQPYMFPLNFLQHCYFEKIILRYGTGRADGQTDGRTDGQTDGVATVNAASHGEDRDV